MIRTLCLTVATAGALWLPLAGVGVTSATAAESATTSASSNADKLAKAQECSRKADAKKLHGEERKKFREECKKS